MLERLRLPVAVAAALVVAEAAVLILRPRGLEPVDVAAQAYFSAAQIERAEDFRSGQLWLYGARLVVELGVLILIVRRPPRWLEKRPVLGGAATAAAISVALTAATLPISAVSRERAKDVGLVTQDWVGWAGDVVKGVAIDAVLIGAGGALLVFGLRRFGRRWWAPATAVVVAFGIAITYAAPILISPLFNTFTPLPRNELRADVLDMAERAGVQVGEVYVMDASRRTTAANAYVAGLGTTKRVVLYDTLVEDFSPEEVRLVVAHELAHQRFDDVPHGLLYVAIVAPFGMLAVARIAERLGNGVPAVFLAIAIMLPAVTTISNQLSRAVEARADRYSMELTGEPEALIAFQRRVAIKNVSDPAPPRWVNFLLGTHPTTMDRIGQALAFSAGRAGGDPPRGGP